LPLSLSLLGLLGYGAARAQMNHRVAMLLVALMIGSVHIGRSQQDWNRPCPAKDTIFSDDVARSVGEPTLD
jgi:hypothetical protein